MGAAGACACAGRGDGHAAVVGGCLGVILGMSADPPNGAHAAFGAGGEVAVRPQVQEVVQSFAALLCPQQRMATGSLSAPTSTETL